MEFSFTGLDGGVYKGAFSELEVVFEGPVPLKDGWQLDRINYWLAKQRYIEFRSGPENPPGFAPSRAWEVTEEHVREVVNGYTT